MIIIGSTDSAEENGALDRRIKERDPTETEHASTIDGALIHDWISPLDRTVLPSLLYF